MIVGCYSLDLYCDLCWEDTATPYAQRSAFPHNFTGKSRAACGKQARVAGWSLRFVSGSKPPRAVCPICKRRRTPPTTP